MEFIGVSLGFLRLSPAAKVEAARGGRCGAVVLAVLAETASQAASTFLRRQSLHFAPFHLNTCSKGSTMQMQMHGH
ncbi:hypothetical protein Bca4012_072202 [Brassica carinata]